MSHEYLSNCLDLCVEAFQQCQGKGWRNRARDVVIAWMKAMDRLSGGHIVPLIDLWLDEEGVKGGPLRMIRLIIGWEWYRHESFMDADIAMARERWGDPSGTASPLWSPGPGDPIYHGTLCMPALLSTGMVEIGRDDQAYPGPTFPDLRGSSWVSSQFG